MRIVSSLSPKLPMADGARPEPTLWHLLQSWSARAHAVTLLLFVVAGTIIAVAALAAGPRWFFLAGVGLAALGMGAAGLLQQRVSGEGGRRLAALGFVVAIIGTLLSLFHVSFSLVLGRFW